MAFYQDQPDETLRFGDVVCGFPLSAIHIKNPARAGSSETFQVELNQPQFAVVATPCCSIKNKMLMLAPLTKIRPAFYDNDYLAVDLVRVNKSMTAEQSVPKKVWEQLPHEERVRRLDMTRSEPLAFAELFVYAPHGLLPAYTVNRRDGPLETGFYMIDFRMISPVLCDSVASAKQAPVYAKRLQLTIGARGDLRNKAAAFFARVPKEDEI